MQKEGVIFVKIKLSKECIEKKETETECSYCRNTKKYSSELKLKKHILLEHFGKLDRAKEKTVVYKYYCPVESCRKHEKYNERFFITRKHLVQHYLKIHNLEKFQCQRCEKKFSTEYLRNHHMESCGKVYICLVCNANYNSYESLIAHSKRKNHQHENMTKQKTQKVKTIDKETLAVASINKTITESPPATRTVSTTTSEYDTSNLCNFSSPATKLTSVFTSTGDLSELPLDMPILAATKATTTDDILSFLNEKDIETFPASKPIKNSSTSTTIDFFNDNEENSLSSNYNSFNKKNLNLNSTINFNEDSLEEIQFESNNKLENTETQTDFGSLFNNNYTQTTFADFDLFGKFDSQTQTNFDDFESLIEETLFTSTHTQTMNDLDDDVDLGMI